MKKIVILIILASYLLSACHNNHLADSLQTINSEQDSTDVISPNKSPYITNTYPNVKLQLNPDKSNEQNLTVNIINNSNETISFSTWYVVETCSDNTWYELPTKWSPVHFDLVTYLVKPNHIEEISYSYTTLYKLKSKTEYRIVIKIKDNYNNSYYLSTLFEAY